MAENAMAKAAARRHRLAQRRKTLGLTQEDLAGLLGIDRSTVVRWERGESEPQPWIQPRLAKALRVTAERLEELLAIGVPARPGGASPVVPRQLPAAVPGFTGRWAELAALTGLLDRSAESTPPAAIVISAIGGTAGVGKTALAVQWAHQVADRFPDGQLYVNLRGYDPDRPVPAADALAGFLRALGVPGPDIPPEEEDRAARYRSLLAGLRLLVVLDNAGSAEQVRPLLPGTPGCAVVLTSRDALAGLVARHGATRMDLDLLPAEEAAGLLRALIGQRAKDDPGAAAELADRCCRLPLALRVAAELAAARPGVPLAGLVAELGDQQQRLNLLDAGGDSRTAVRAVFSWSYRHLDDGTARAFRLIGLHPGADFDPYAVAALTRAGLAGARAVLDALGRAHLIQPAGPGRYGMHDLLRAYARELAAATDGEEEQDAALTRLFDHYLCTAAAAMDVLYPAERHRRPRIPPPATPIPPVSESPAAQAWLDAEHAALLAVTVHAAGHGWPGHATRLSATLFRYLINGGHYPDALIIFGHALGAARRTGDPNAEATALSDMGGVDYFQGRFQQAADRYQQALALFGETGDRAGEARMLQNLGLTEIHLGRHEHAARHLEDAVRIFRDISDRLGEEHALGNLGMARRRQGRYQEAADYYRQALALSRQVGDHGGEAMTLLRLGFVDLRLGRYQQAADYYRQALALFRGIARDRGEEAEALVSLGEVDLRLGRIDQAAGNIEQGLAIFREIGDRDGEAQALNGLGNVLCQAGDVGTARARHTEALRLTCEADMPLEEAQAHEGLARAYDADGDAAQARHHWQAALTIYDAIGAAEAREIRARLASAGDNDHADHKPAQQDSGTSAPSPE